MKTIAFALAALIAGSAVAAPALAADSANFDADFYTAQLRYDGINAIDTEDHWNNAFRAIVQLDDGSKVFKYFDKDTFQPVSYGG